MFGVYVYTHIMRNESPRVERGARWRMRSVEPAGKCNPPFLFFYFFLYSYPLSHALDQEAMSVHFYYVLFILRLLQYLRFKHFFVRFREFLNDSTKTRDNLFRHRSWLFKSLNKIFVDWEDISFISSNYWHSSDVFQVGYFFYKFGVISWERIRTESNCEPFTNFRKRKQKSLYLLTAIHFSIMTKASH